eukprot:gnl/TRDRNA2_/TRDRNA2_195702_c0_seq1.p1 gnl/TRDRNA2_/TRDRNA2_195702_c0~~gnl/TRDRNA2_/TRDRNA2_195702_c0_seq1.p1  ORF type:complete len:502 (-),score=106.00 gnl/TRDRNA2_/TRDRNA2_195702_c0_seq1:50-1525(-)
MAAADGAIDPLRLYTAILKAANTAETAGAIATALAAEVNGLPVDAFEAVIGALKGPPTVPDPNHEQAQTKILAGLPRALQKRSAPIPRWIEFHGMIADFGGPQAPAMVVDRRQRTSTELVELIGDKALKDGIKGCSVKALGALCKSSALKVSASILTGMGDAAVEHDEVKSCAAHVASQPLQAWSEMPREVLLRLVVAATKSASVAEGVLGAVAAAAAATWQAWPVDDVLKLLLALAKAKGGATGVDGLFSGAPQVLMPKLPEMSMTQLIKVVLAVGKVSSCKALLEAGAAEAGNKLSEFAPAQLVLLTQGLVALGGDHPQLAKVLDVWATSCEEWVGKGSLTADQLAKLAQLAAPVAPSHASFWAAVGKHLAAKPEALTDAGKASVQAAFPDGAGPDFEGKANLLKTVQPAPKAPEKDNRDSKKDSEKDRDRDRDRRRSRSRSGKKDDRRGGDRDRSRDRGRDDRDRGRGRDRSRDRDRRDRSRSRGRRR